MRSSTWIAWDASSSLARARACSAWPGPSRRCWATGSPAATSSTNTATPVILERIGVTLGAHPVPDEGCVRGCRRILEMARGLTERDLVFTIAANGISALLTLPVPGVSLEDVRRTTYLMQIERGAPTGDLNPVRNHLDMMKGGRISRYIQPAQRHPHHGHGPGDHDELMYHNVWLHTLPDAPTYADAVAMLKKWDAWDAVPASVREHLQRADPRYETVKAEEFERSTYRIYGVMPTHLGMLPTAAARPRAGVTSRMSLSTGLASRPARLGPL